MLLFKIKNNNEFLNNNFYEKFKQDSLKRKRNH